MFTYYDCPEIAQTDRPRCKKSYHKPVPILDEGSVRGIAENRL
jgi:hypothetical protein